MGRGGGTGSSFTFFCTKCRRSRGFDRKKGSADRCRLTGREKPSRSAYRNYGRQTDTQREYECMDCGHVGWSTHRGLRDYGIREEK